MLHKQSSEGIEAQYEELKTSLRVAVGQDGGMVLPHALLHFRGISPDVAPWKDSPPNAYTDPHTSVGLDGGGLLDGLGTTHRRPLAIKAGANHNDIIFRKEISPVWTLYFFGGTDYPLLRYVHHHTQATKQRHLLPTHRLQHGPSHLVPPTFQNTPPRFGDAS